MGLLTLLPGWGLKIARAVLDTKGDPERLAQIDAEIEDRRNRRDVVIAGMQFKIFWLAWSIAAVPTAAWFGWGMLDSLANGALPDVAALPPQLKEYADIVFGNIFYAGAAGAGVQAIVGAVTKRR